MAFARSLLVKRMGQWSSVGPERMISIWRLIDRMLADTPGPCDKSTHTHRGTLRPQDLLLEETKRVTPSYPLAGVCIGEVVPRVGALVVIELAHLHRIIPPQATTDLELLRGLVGRRG
jgi:hypothetical protein